MNPGEEGVLLLGVHHVPSCVLPERRGARPNFGPGILVEVTAAADRAGTPVYEGRLFDGETGDLLHCGHPSGRPAPFRSRLKAPLRRFWERETLGAPLPDGLRPRGERAA